MQWYRYAIEKYSRYLHIANSIWGMFCICAVFAMVGIIGYWIGQPQFFYAVTQISPVVLDVSSTGDVYYPNVIISGAGKAIYTQWIEDNSGHKIFEYRPMVLESQGATVQHEQIMIPPLKPGFYFIKAEMVNQPNPLKSIKVDLTLGTIHVVAPEEDIVQEHDH